MFEGGSFTSYQTTTEIFQAKKERQNLSRIGLSLAVYLVLMLVIQYLVSLVFRDYITAKFPVLVESGWFLWLMVYLPQFIICVPVAYFMLRIKEPQEISSGDISAANYVQIMIMCVTVLYIGNLIGTFFSNLLGAGNALEALAVNSNLWATLLFAVILVPITEEFVFRKLVMDRLRKYGDKIAILLSALLFALIHANLAQFFYAFGLGILFGYVYTRTGKLRYSIGLHMFVNFLGMFVGTLILRLMENVDLEAVSNMSAAGNEVALEQAGGLLLVGFYGIAMIALTIIGLILIVTKWKKAQLKAAVVEIPQGQRAKIIFGNPGIILFIICSILGMLSPFLLVAAGLFS
ncbi:MAG: CPBP family intramembrane metalloprotease [Firmicutes bacterium]|nr:CPBP family intramembrane metalloprotease [Bacillota bacterium]